MLFVHAEDLGKDFVLSYFENTSGNSFIGQTAKHYRFYMTTIIANLTLCYIYNLL